MVEQLLVNDVITGSIYALIALGFSLWAMNNQQLTLTTSAQSEKSAICDESA